MCINDTSAKIRKAIHPCKAGLGRKNYPLHIGSAPIFAKILQMEMQKRNKGLYWILFLVSVALTAFAIATHWPWLTLLLPFVFTFFVLALDIV
jgi:hypothetical protein